jgi:hypothetical protein
MVGAVSRLARAFPVVAELVNLLAASWRYGREETRDDLRQAAAPPPPLAQLADDRVAAEANLRRKWTRWL